ncbi:uncharacterized protein DS421_7g205720 [Arachis hypogaea]|nr:uncharacterized protein DS421_7g205720 [Arachis hypogaea]
MLYHKLQLMVSKFLFLDMLISTPSCPMSVVCGFQLLDNTIFNLNHEFVLILLAKSRCI